MGGALGGLLHFASAQSSADEYDVEKQTKAGKENRAYVTEGSTPAAPSTRPTSSAGGKWANNYVPYGDFPQGSKEDAVNGTNGEVEKNGETVMYHMKKNIIPISKRSWSIHQNNPY